MNEKKIFIKTNRFQVMISLVVLINIYKSKIILI